MTPWMVCGKKERLARLLPAFRACEKCAIETLTISGMRQKGEAGTIIARFSRMRKV
jgi:hypothetical protein